MPRIGRFLRGKCQISTTNPKFSPLETLSRNCFFILLLLCVISNQPPPRVDKCLESHGANRYSDGGFND